MHENDALVSMLTLQDKCFNITDQKYYRRKISQVHELESSCIKMSISLCNVGDNVADKPIYRVENPR